MLDNKKFCPGCRTSVSYTEYYKNKSTRDGYQDYCKFCQKQKSNNYWSSEKGKKVRKKWHDKYKNTGVSVVYAKKYRTSEKGRKTKARLQLARYYSDVEYGRMKLRAYSAGSNTEIISNLFLEQKNCQMCGAFENLQVDHVFPVSLGGLGIKENLQLLCGDCNSFKSNHIFLPDGGMLKSAR